MRLIRCSAPFALGALLALATACGSDDSTGPRATIPTALRGTFGNDSETGTIALTVTAASLRGVSSARSGAFAGVTGSMHIIDGATITLTGTLNGTAFSITGGGYTMTGVLRNDGVIIGSYTGPNGPGDFALSDASGSAAVYCGWYRIGPAGEPNDSGFFNVTVTEDDDLTGLAISVFDGDVTRLIGTVTGSGSTRTVNVFDADAPSSGVANGPITATTVSGTVNAPGTTGAFAGSTAACID